MRYQLRLISSILLLGCAHISLAQFTPDRSQREPNFQDPLDTLDQGNLGPDTTIYNHFSLYNPALKIAFSDTTLEDFHNYDPLRKQDIFGAHLGNLGSSGRDLMYGVPYRRGLDFGYHNYDKYRMTRDQVRWYDVNRPFSDFFFSPGGSQKNFIIKAQFSRTFADSVSFNIDYQRISQEGWYSDQETKQTYVAAGIRILRDKTDTYILGIHNTNNEEHNGGVPNRALFAEPFSNFRQTIPTALSDANTRQSNIELSINNYYNVKDSVTQKINYSLRHEFAIQSGANKFFDESDTDANQYLPFVMESRGLRNRMGYYTVENGFYLNLDNSASHLSAGIVYNYFKVNQEPLKFNKNNLFLLADANMKLFGSSVLNLKGHFGLLDNGGDLWAQGDINLGLKTFGDLSGGLKLYRYTPSLLHQSLFFNELVIWDNEFSKVNGTELFGTLTNSKLGLEVSISLHAQDNALYYDASKQAVQLDGAFTSTKIFVKHKLKFGALNFHNKLLFQSFNENIYSLPSWLTEHNLYLEGMIFKKKMLARLGTELRLGESYFPGAFAPEISNFYLQNTIQEDLYTVLDVYTSFKIDEFRAFFKCENILQLLNDEIPFLVPNYPQFDFQLRVGVAWLIKD